MVGTCKLRVVLRDCSRRSGWFIHSVFSYVSISFYRAYNLLFSFASIVVPRTSSSGRPSPTRSAYSPSNPLHLSSSPTPHYRASGFHMRLKTLRVEHKARYFMRSHHPRRDIRAALGLTFHERALSRAPVPRTSSPFPFSALPSFRRARFFCVRYVSVYRAVVAASCARISGDPFAPCRIEPSCRHFLHFATAECAKHRCSDIFSLSKDFARTRAQSYRHGEGRLRSAGGRRRLRDAFRLLMYDCKESQAPFFVTRKRNKEGKEDAGLEILKFFKN